MLNLYTISTKSKGSFEGLNENEKSSVLYHDLFDYPLDFPDLIRWKSGKQLSIRLHHSMGNYQFTNKRGFHFLDGHEGLIYKRLLRKRISAKKMKIAKKYAKVLAFIPGVEMVAVTGSLAMENSSEESDIDLMIITKRGMLWTTRLFTYSLIRLFGIGTRKPNDLIQKDKLCLNMWLDESDLTWKKSDRNLYTAHEIAQIVPLVNKDKTYEKFLHQNKWVLDFWPNAVRIWNLESGIWNKKTRRMHHFVGNILDSIFLLVEKNCYWIQKKYMEKKITREIITKTRALFHPQDWGKVVMSRLSS